MAKKLEIDLGGGKPSKAAQDATFMNVFGAPGQIPTGAEGQVVNLPMRDIHGFPNHPFKVNYDEELIELRDSIAQYGVLEPITVRPRAEGGWTVISGHRRLLANQKAGKDDIICIVRNLSDDEATILMVDSNMHREKILPSEKAWSFRMKLEAMSHQGTRTDLTSSQLETKLKGSRADTLLSQQNTESRATIQRCIRLTYLITPILDWVDEDKIAVGVAYELSFLQTEEQKYLYDTMKTLEKTPNISQAQEMKRLSSENQLTQTQAMGILIKPKANQKEYLKIEEDKIDKYLSPSLTPIEKQSQLVERLDTMDKIHTAVKKHLPKGKELLPDELVKMIDNMLTDYARSKAKNNQRE